MKQRIKNYLSRHPALYRLILRAKRNSSVEIITFLRLIKDGDVVFDLGANRGDFTVLFSHIVGDRGQIHAFEPVPPTFARLSQRVGEECRFRNVSLNQFALGDASGSFQIHVPAGDFGQASLKAHDVASWSKPGRESFECEVRTLDAYVSEKAVNRIDCVKIDVEGAELPALRGARQTLDRFHPTLHVEYFGQWTAAFGYAAKELVNFLESLGYRYFYDAELASLPDPLKALQKGTEPYTVVCSVRPLIPTLAS